MTIQDANNGYRGLENGELVALPRQKEGGNTYEYIVTTSLISGNVIGNFNSDIISTFDSTNDCNANGSVTLDVAKGEMASIASERRDFI